MFEGKQKLPMFTRRVKTSGRSRTNTFKNQDNKVFIEAIIIFVVAFIIYNNFEFAFYTTFITAVEFYRSRILSYFEIF